MSDSRPRASDVAAQQVERIVAAAQAAADQILEEAGVLQRKAQEQGERDAKEIRHRAQAEGQKELNKSRKQAIVMSQDAKREAEALLSESKRESEQLREQTQSAVEGRVAAAEKASSEVLAEARALSGGLHQLGHNLQEHADRILRDVQAAHKRMQADLRVGPDGLGVSGVREEPIQRGSRPVGEPAGRDAPARERPESATPAGGRRRPNPFDDLEVPSWTRDR
jgi:hypothetical protein